MPANVERGPHAKPNAVCVDEDHASRPLCNHVGNVVLETFPSFIVLAMFGDKLDVFLDDLVESARSCRVVSCHLSEGPLRGAVTFMHESSPKSGESCRCELWKYRAEG